MSKFFVPVTIDVPDGWDASMIFYPGAPRLDISMLPDHPIAKAMKALLDWSEHDQERSLFEKPLEEAADELRKFVTPETETIGG